MLTCEQVPGAAVPPAGYFALVCIYLFAGFFQWGWGPGLSIVSALLQLFSLT